MNSKRFFGKTIAALALGSACFGAFAQADYPNKPIKMIVAFPPGGTSDVMGRLMAEELTKVLKQPVVVENIGGAGGVVGTDRAVKMPADGYTIIQTGVGQNAVAHGLDPNLKYNSVTDFIHVSQVHHGPNVLVVNSQRPFRTVKELVAFAKANPGKLNIGTINIGSTQNLAGELFKTTAGIDAQIVPFNGTPAVITALRGGQVDVAVEILGPVMSQIKSDAVRALAVTGDKRAAVLPDVPTAKEAGVANLSAASWNALAAPAKTPRAVIDRLHKEAAAAVNSSEVKKKLAELNVDAQAASPEQTAALLASEIKRWGDVIVRAKIPQQ